MGYQSAVGAAVLVLLVGLPGCGDDDDSSSNAGGGTGGNNNGGSSSGGSATGATNSGGSGGGGSSAGGSNAGGSNNGGSNMGGSSAGLTPPAGMCHYPGFGACKIQVTCRSYVDPADEAIKADQQASCAQFGEWFDDGQCPTTDAIGVCWRCDVPQYQAEVAYKPADAAMYKTKCEGIMGVWVDL